MLLSPHFLHHVTLKRMTQHYTQGINGRNVNITKSKGKSSSIPPLPLDPPNGGPQRLEPPAVFKGPWLVCFIQRIVPIYVGNIRIAMNPSGFNGNVSQSFVEKRCSNGFKRSCLLRSTTHRSQGFCVVTAAPCSPACEPSCFAGEQLLFLKDLELWLLVVVWFQLNLQRKTQFKSWVFIQFGLRVFGQCIYQIYVTKPYPTSDTPRGWTFSQGESFPTYCLYLAFIGPKELYTQNSPCMSFCPKSLTHESTQWTSPSNLLRFRSKFAKHRGVFWVV